MHGYGMGPGSEWSTENWPRSPGKPIRGTIERADRQHGRACRVICACVPLGRLFINPGRAVGIQDEVLYASDLREVASEEFYG
ncbi:hypothetical protein F2Q68_00002847 [Brassica cretica]|uniref:Uncharacterized protein n=1 Tax=Brassica cretica TaxID=69181 RepID=A0A8S9JL47_BRACR|nr:hypothetical protein F2Q68_00002847 [Brassica cretica]